MIGKTVSHYKIIEELGRGGMGVVYKAEDLKLKRTVALKFLPPEFTRDPEAKARFIREAQAASSLQHNNICTIHEIDETEDGQIFICMDCYTGKTLKEKISSGRLKIEDAVDIAIRIAKGLKAAHDAGEIHRDIKPENILITDKNEIKIVDFGLALLENQSQTMFMEKTIGTAAYMSPQQAKGEAVDARSDIWSLGVVLYEMLTGQLPFKGEYPQAVLYSIINEEPPPPSSVRSEIPQELERIILKMLVKEPNKRYRNISEVLTDLNNFLEEYKGRLSAAADSDKNAGHRKKIIKAAVISLFILLIIFSAFFFFIHKEQHFLARPIAVISFENQTGDQKYDYLSKAIPNLLITKLEESEHLRVISWERMYDLLKRINKQNVERIDRKLGFEICRMDSINTIVIGSYTKAGGVFATDVKVLDVKTKKLLKSASSRGEGVGSILKSQIDELSDKIISGINIPQPKEKAKQYSVSEMTTESMPAYKYFLKAREAYFNLYFKEAREYCIRAIKYDSTFARAYILLYLSSQNDTHAEGALRKAYKYAYKAGKWHYFIDGLYARNIEKNRNKALKIFHEMIKKFPKDKLAWYILGSVYISRKENDKALPLLKKALSLDPLYTPALNNLGYCYLSMHNYTEAEQAFERYIRLEPDKANPYDSMGDFYFVTNNPDAAANYYRKAIARKADFISSWKLSYLYAMKEDYLNTFKWIEYFINRNSVETRKRTGRLYKAFYHYWIKEYAKAISDLEKIISEGENAETDLAQTYSYLLLSRIYCERGDYDKAGENLNDWYKLRIKTLPDNFLNMNPDFFHALYELYLSNIAAAKGEVDSLNSRVEKAVAKVQNIGDGNQKALIVYFAEILRAKGALVRENEQKALEIMSEIQSTLYSGELKLSKMVDFNSPFAEDIRAKAYMSMGAIDKAVAEYERLISPERVKRLHRLIPVIYHYRLAKLYERKGWPGKAIEQYKLFLSICKNADKNIDEISEAEREYKKLTALR